jgi:hypothetical protein
MDIKFVMVSCSASKCDGNVSSHRATNNVANLVIHVLNIRFMFFFLAMPILSIKKARKKLNFIMSYTGLHTVVYIEI